MDDVKIIKESADVVGLQKEVTLIYEKYARLLTGQPQISLQSNDPDVTPVTGWNCSIGRWEYIAGLENDYIYPVFPEAKLINHYLNLFKMTRARIMVNHPKECMTIHQDISPRVHIPVHSNEKCLMVIDKMAYYLAPGKVYWTDTTKPHTALNGSRDKRIHIVGCVKE